MDIGYAGWTPNDGCQCTDTDDRDWNDSSNCPDNYLPLPAGWVLAPNDATSIAVIAAHGWSTDCAVLADGTAWMSANSGGLGSPTSRHYLATSGGTYTVTACTRRVLARCG